MAMRIRQIHPNFWLSESVGSVGFFERLLFQAIWGLADREGLLLYKPAHIMAQAFPYDKAVTKEKVAAGVSSLVEAGLVRLISVEGIEDQAIYVPKFLKYQWINKNEAKSKLAAIYLNTVNAYASTVNAYEPAENAQGFLSGIQVFSISGNQDTDSGVTPERAPPPPERYFVMMPVKDGFEAITDEDVAGWKALYGRIDVERSLKQMVGYWTALPANKRKTRGGIRKSINTWLAKDDDRAPTGFRGNTSGYIEY